METTINCLNDLQGPKARQTFHQLKNSFEIMMKQGWDIIKIISDFLLKYEADTAMKSMSINFNGQNDNQEEVKEEQSIPNEIYNEEQKISSFSYISNKKLKEMENNIHSLYSHALTLESAYEKRTNDYEEMK